MDLKKRKYFTLTKEESFLISLLLSYCFYLKTKNKNLVLIKFCYNAADLRFLKTFRKFARGRSMMETIFKVSVFQDELSCEPLSISFLNTFSQLLPNIEQKRIPLDDYNVWCKKSRVIKD